MNLSVGNAIYCLEVVLPLATPTTYYYLLEQSKTSLLADELVGYRLVVPLRTKKFYTGIILSVHQGMPEGVPANKLRYAMGVVGSAPLVSAYQIELWRWLADYYCCSLGSVLRLAIPKGLLPESQTLIRVTEDFSTDEPLLDQEVRILDVLTSVGDKGMTLEKLQNALGERISRAYHHLLEIGAITTEEALHERHRTRLVAYLQLSEGYRSDVALQSAFDLINRAKRRAEVLTLFLTLLLEDGVDYDGMIERARLSNTDHSNSAHVRKLVEQGILTVVMHPENRIHNAEQATKPYAYTSANAPLLPKPISLLTTQDVEAKESAVISLVAGTISEGGQVLLLSPSASGVPRAFAYLDALRQAAGGRMYYYHSEVSELKRNELYCHLSTTDEPCLVVGNRSAIFLPCSQLRLIIIDEEQEYLYKQQFHPPFYHARDVALYVASQRGVQIVLASTSPSAESLFNVYRGKYGLLPLSSSLSPEALNSTPAEIVNLKSVREKIRGRSIISPTLRQRIEEQILGAKRVLLIQNRKGYAPYVVCRHCSSSLRCPHCDLSLHYLASRQQLTCSQCGHIAPLPMQCPSCSAGNSLTDKESESALRLVGYGVERVEEELNDLFPDARILRLDGETLQSASKRKESYQRIDSGEVDIIVGTQVIKSQPIWDNIGLVAILQLDELLSFPDFRAGERTFQLLHQLRLYSSQAGRPVGTKILLQTSQPDNPFIAQYVSGSYEQYMQGVLAERKRYNWPPFSRVTYIYLRGEDLKEVERIAHAYASALRQRLGDDWVSSVQAISQTKVQGRYVRHIVCRRPYQISYRKERQAYAEVLERLRMNFPEMLRIAITYDVDPL